MPESNVEAVKAKVQAILVDIATVTLESNGYSIAMGSTKVFVDVSPFGDESTVIRLWAPVLIEVTPSNELYEYVALNADAYVFGHLHACLTESGTVNILMSHNLLGDFIDRDEIGRALYAVVGTADGIDNELQKRFGGKLLSEI